MTQFKKTHIIGLGVMLGIIVIGALSVLLSGKPEVTSEKSLAELQQVQTITEQETSLTQEDRLSPEKQKQLDQIKELYSSEEEAYRSSLKNILRKYNSNFSETDEEIFFSTLEEYASSEELTKAFKEKLSISFLQTDVKKILDAKVKLTGEKTLTLSRLESFQEKNTLDLNGKTQALIELSLTESLRQHSSLSTQQINTISKRISLKLFAEANNILGYQDFEEQKKLLQDTISSELTTINSLSALEKKSLITQIEEDIYTLEILLPANEIKEDTSTSFRTRSPIFEGFQKLGSLLFAQAHAAEPLVLTPTERAILILKTEIFIERILQESIETEILYNKGTITQGEYETIIEENLIELEELVILKDSLENDPDALSLDDIQRFNLGSYVDDSVAVQNLPILAYIQDKTGHIIIHNLNGSSKLGEENMPLYAGYGIETLGSSTTTIVFSDESVLRLDALSKVDISTPSSSSINVAVEKGTIWTRVLKPLLSGDIFTIDSDGISLGVRGTSLAITKTAGNTTINIVDSYTSDGSPSVILTDSGGNESSIAAGKEISVNTAGNISVSDVNKTQLMIREPQVAEFLREDLQYLSLLADDRERGFYNTPFVSRNDSEEFLQKIVGELQVSLPQTTERSYIIQNTELATELVSTGSMYHLIQKDILIRDIKNNPIGNTAAKIQAVKDLDMQALEDTLGNKRDLENRFDYNIAEDIISQTTFTTSELENIFLGFPIVPVQDDARLLSEVKNQLSINNRNSIVTSDISLPTSQSGVTITWESQNPSIISQTGRVNPVISDTSVILTANLSIGNLSTTKDFGLVVVPRVPTPLEELQAAETLLTDYISNIAHERFSDRITLPDFGANGVITPSLEWTGSSLINTNGSTNQPGYLEPPFNDPPYNLFQQTTVSLTLTHPTNTSVVIPNISYTLKIERLPGTAREIADAALLRAKQDFYNYYTPNPSVRTDVEDTLPFLSVPAGVILRWQNGDRYISEDGDIDRPTYNESDIPKTVSVIFSHIDTTRTETLWNIKLKIKKQNTCPGEIIGTYCYELVASAEYNTPGDIDLISSTGARIPRPSSGNVNLNTCGQAANPNGSVTGGTGNCGWTTTGALASMYNYTASKITDFNPIKSWLTYDGQSGIVIENVGDPDYLPYDISSLNLGDDWAIEMSVRGEDLERLDTNYSLLNIPSILKIYRIKPNNGTIPTHGFGIYQNSGNYDLTGNSFGGGYKVVRLLRKGIDYTLNIDGLPLSGSIPVSGTNNTIYIGTNSSSGEQWNGIINYIKIYKKKE